MNKSIIIGGGASGMMCAIISAKKGNQVTIIEKNEKLGKKIYITGKGRCNLCNDCDNAEFLENVVSNKKFMYGAINSFSPQDTMKFFSDNGLQIKVERGNRVFPFSDKASDVTKILTKLLEKYNVNIKLNTKVESILVKDSKVYGVKTNSGDFFADTVTICTGGKSYPLTGSTGDGYIFARQLGHKIIETKPALVGIELKDNLLKDCQGVSLKNVSLIIKRGEKVISNQFGEMLFTHFGISGPIVLTTSSLINRMNFNELSSYLDFKPALLKETIDLRLLREFKENNNKTIANIIRGFFPQNFVKPFLLICQIKIDKKCSEITINERNRIVDTMKAFPLKLKSLRNIDEAIITSGGVSVNEINPKTMESKIIKGLFFAGEVIDVDCFTGGFNLQTAFSTGFVAGNNN